MHFQDMVFTQKCKEMFCSHSIWIFNSWFPQPLKALRETAEELLSLELVFLKFAYTCPEPAFGTEIQQNMHRLLPHPHSIMLESGQSAENLSVAYITFVVCV